MYWAFSHLLPYRNLSQHFSSFCYGRISHSYIHCPTSPGEGCGGNGSIRSTSAPLDRSSDVSKPAVRESFHLILGMPWGFHPVGCAWIELYQESTWEHYCNLPVLAPHLRGAEVTTHSLMTIGEDRDVGWPVNTELPPQTELFHLYRLILWL